MIPMSFAAIAAVALLSGCKNKELGPSILERLVEARARTLTDKASYREVSSDPEGSAHRAAARRDYRLIRYAVTGFTLEHSDLAGVRCALPVDLMPIIQRETWTQFVNDMPMERPVPVDFTPARRFNREMLAQPGFPWGDLCLATPDNFDTPQAHAIKQVDLARMTNRRALEVRADNPLAVNIRNGVLQHFVPPEKIDYADAFGLTPLAWAAVRSPSAIVAKMLSWRADPLAGARCHIPPGKTGDIFYRHLELSPLGFAARAKREDVVNMMLDSHPSMACPTDGDNDGKYAELNLRMRMVDVLADTPTGQRRLFSDTIAFAARLSKDPKSGSAYETVIDNAVGYKMTDLFRVRPDAEVISNRTALLDMALRGQLEELQYWVRRFGSKQDDIERLATNAPNAMTTISSCGSDCSGDGLRKLNWLLDQLGRPTTEQNETMLNGAFGNRYVGDRDPLKLRRIVTAFTSRGYNFGYGTGCTFLMYALSYHYSDECDGLRPSPAFAKILLEQAPHVETLRTSAGLTALDLARRRADRGPHSEGFRPLVAELERRGVPETRRPTPRN